MRSQGRYHRELNRQTFQQCLVGHDVGDDLHIRMLLFVARENVLQDFAAIAIIGAGEADFLRG